MSLVRGSINDAMLLTEFLSAASTPSATAQPQLALTAASPTAAVAAVGPSSSTTVSAWELLLSLNKRLNNVLVGVCSSTPLYHQRP